MIRSTKDFWTGVIYILIGSSAVLLAREFGIGTAVRMGAGYFPTVLGIVLISVGAVAVIRAFIVSGPPIGVFAFKGLLLVVCSVFLFGFIVRDAGLVIALPLLVIISALASIHFRWAPTMALAAGLTVFCALVFIKGLGVPLPLIGPWFGG
ncbi:MAG: tripartite tricarboxylate transporter TctB family protein [Candidatus Binatia bacterium]